MNRRIQILQHLYGEQSEPDRAADRAADEAALQRMLDADAALREEYEALCEARFHLDHRRRERPDPRVIDAVVAAAAPVVGARRDRAPRSASWRSAGRLLRSVAIAVPVLLLAALGIWQVGQPDERAAEAPSGAAADMAKAAPGRVAPGPVMQTRPLAGPPPLPAAEAAGRAPAQVVLQWDEADDVRRLHRRVEVLQARSSRSGWDAPFGEQPGVTPASRGASAADDH